MKKHDRIANSNLEVAHLCIEHADNTPTKVGRVDLWIRNL
jgi:hypothetical protein